MNKLLLLFLCTMLLGGCATHGTEEQLMVVVLGVDQHDENVKLIAKVPSFSASGDSGAASGDGYLTLTASGDTLASALSLLHATAPRNLNYSQTRQVLISSDLLWNHPDFIHQLSRIDGMRSQTTVSVCQGSAEEIITQQKATIGTRLSRYIDTTLETAVREGYIPDSTLIRVLTQLGGGYQDALIAYSGMDQKDQKKQQDQKAAPAISQPSESLAGAMPHTSGNAIEWMGAAAMDGQHLSGFLSGFETALCRFLLREIEFLPFQTEQGVAILTARLGPHLSIHGSDPSLTLQIEADLNMLPQLGAHIDPDLAQKTISQSITDLLYTLQSLRCDALGFGGIAAREHITLSSWETSDWKSRFTQANVHAEVHITPMDE